MDDQQQNQVLNAPISQFIRCLGVAGAIAYVSAYHTSTTTWANAIDPFVYISILVGIGALVTLRFTRQPVSGITALGVSLIPVAGFTCSFAFS